MTAITTGTTTTRTCPPSAVADMIVAWPDVQPGDVVLWDGEFRSVEHINPMDYGNPAFVLDGDEHNGTIPVGTYTAVRRYTEGTSERDALVIAALDEAAEERAYRASEFCHACPTADSGMCEEHRGHLDMAEQYRAERDRREAGL